MGGGNPNDDLDLYYPYHPSIVAESIFLATFTIFGFIFIYQSVSMKKYYLLLMALFALTEAGGYAARLAFAEKFELKNTYLSQIIILVLAPNIIQAYMYTQTADLIGWANLDAASWFKRYGTNLPTYFILSDFICLVIQGSAGAMLGSTNASQAEINLGRTIILIGLILQLASLFLFCFVLISFVKTIRNEEKEAMKYYLYAMYIGIGLVIIRNIYRVAEFAEGSMTGGALNKKELYVLLADASTMTIASFFFAYWSVAYLPIPEKYDTLPITTQVVVSAKTAEVEFIPTTPTNASEV